MKYTDIIDKYLDDEMTLQEKAAFEQDVKTDPELAQELKLHQLAIAGVQHSEEARFQEFKSRMKAIENEVEEIIIEEPQSTEEAVENEAEETIEKPEPRMEVVENKGKEEEKPNRRIKQWIMGIAAILIPLLLLYFLLPLPNVQSNPIAATSNQLIEFYTSNNKGKTPSTPQATLFNEAIQLFEQENYQAALPILDRLISENSENRAKAQVLKADALYRQGNKIEALQTLKSINKPDDNTLYEKVQKIITEME